MKISLVVAVILSPLVDGSFLPAKDAKVETNQVAANPKLAAKVAAKSESKPVSASEKLSVKASSKAADSTVKPTAKVETKLSVASPKLTDNMATPEAKPVVSKGKAEAASPRLPAKDEKKPGSPKAAETTPVVASLNTLAKVQTKPALTSSKLPAGIETPQEDVYRNHERQMTPPVVTSSRVETKEVLASPKKPVANAVEVPHAAVAVAVVRAQSNATNPTVHEHSLAAQKSADEAVHHLEQAKKAFEKTKANVKEAIDTGKKIEGTAKDIKTLYTPPKPKEAPKPKVESGASALAAPVFLAFLLAMHLGNC